MAVRSRRFGSVAAGAAAMALALGCGGAGSAAAAPAAVVPAATGAVDYCGASASDLLPDAAAPEPAPAPSPPVPPVPPTAPGAPGAPVGGAGAALPQVSYVQPKQLPIGLWSAASVTLRVLPAAHGTVRLDLASKGFSTDSMEVQRWVPAGHRWVDLTSSSGSDAFPTRGTFSFAYTAPAAAGQPGRIVPQTVALRLQDLDRPGSLTVAASYADGHGHTYRAPALGSPVTRPQTTFTGWPAHVALVRGGAAREFTMTVKNTTDRAYPEVTALFYAYGLGGGRALTPRDLVLRQYRAGHGWTRLPLVASGCDPGMSVNLAPAAGVALAPGASETVRLRLGVAKAAPRRVTSAEAGLSVQSVDTSLASGSLPFTVRG